MAENSNQQTPRNISHSRSISTIPKRHNNISFMPKFLIKTLQRKRQHHRQRSLTFPGGINVESNDTISSSSDKHEKKGKNKRIDKQAKRTNQLMQLLPSRRNVGSIVSALFGKNKKSSDQEQRKDHRPRSLVNECSNTNSDSEKPFSDFLTDSTHAESSVKGKAKKEVSHSEKFSDQCKPAIGNAAKLSLKGRSLGRLRSLSKTGGNMQVKAGLKIRAITRIRSREKEEKRFELCKKKILMGGKCRPLNGSLRYDKQGVLVPQDL